MQTRRDYKHDPHWKTYGEAPGPEVSFIAPDDAKLPANVRRLHAADIICYDDKLDIMFQVAGFHNMGFIAYAAGVTNIPDKVTGERREKVIEGLWFYDDVSPTDRMQRAPR